MLRLFFIIGFVIECVVVVVVVVVVVFNMQLIKEQKKLC
jgi:hypothetical protein